MISWFKRADIVDENSALWLIDTFHWAVEYFDADIFKQQTSIILPTNEFFPGKVSSIEEMSQAIFSNVKRYAHIDAWPIILQQPANYSPSVAAKLSNHITSRRLPQQLAPLLQLSVSFQPAQLNKPQDLIAHFALQLSHFVAVNINQKPPGGADYWSQALEVLACFFGFGIMQANSAYTFRGGCGSCYNAAANRQAALPENELIFLLAIYCHLKQIDNKSVLPHLKPYLRRLFKRAQKQLLTSYPTELTKIHQQLNVSAALN